MEGMTSPCVADRARGSNLAIDPRRLFAGVAVAFAIAAEPAVAAEPAFRPSETIFPATTAAWLSVADPVGLQESFDRTQYGKLLQDPIMEPFVTSFRKQLSKAGKRRLGKLGLTLEDLGEVPGGEIALAAIVPEAERLATVLLVDTTGHEEETTKLLEQIDRRLLEQQAERLADYQETIKVYRLPPEPPRADADDEAPPPAERLVAVVHQAAALIVGDDPVQVHHVLTVLETGRQDSLASRADFEAVQTRSREGLPAAAASLRWYVDPFSFAAAYKATHPPVERRKGPDYVEILGRQGFDAVEALGGSMIFDDGPRELRHQTIVYAPPLPGRDPAAVDRYDLAARMLRFPETDAIEPPAWVPADASSWSALQWDIATAFKVADTLVDDIVGEKGVFDDVIASLKEDPDGPQIDVEADRQAMRRWWLAHVGQPSSLVRTRPLRPRAEHLWSLLSRRYADRWTYQPLPEPILCAGQGRGAEMLESATADYNLVRTACIWLGSSQDAAIQNRLIDLVGSPLPVVAHNSRFALKHSRDKRVRETLLEFEQRQGAGLRSPARQHKPNSVMKL